MKHSHKPAPSRSRTAPVSRAELQSSFATSLETIKNLEKVEYLLLDDFGAEKATDFAQQSIHILLDQRERNKRVTYFTSNLNLDLVEEIYGSRIASRICGACEIAKINGRDKRLFDNHKK